MNIFKKNAQRRTLFFIKLFFLPFGLFYLLKKICVNDYLLLNISLNAHFFWALFSMHAAYFIFSMRFYYLARLHRVGLGMWGACRIFLESMFYYFFMPMSVGMEVSRYQKIRRINSAMSGVQVFSFLLADRVWGMLGALLICLVCFPYVSLKNLPTIKHHWSILLLVLIFLILTAGVVIVKSARLRNFIKQIFLSFSCHYKHFLPLVMLSALCQLLMSWAALEIVGALHFTMSYLAILFTSSLSLFFALIPLSFAGISSVESANVIFLLSFGYDYQAALATVSVMYSIKLLAALEGGVCEFFTNLADGRRLT